MSLVNSNNGFSKLEEVWLGDTYPMHFYDHLEPEVRDVFYQITEWTKDDLAPMEKKLQELGVTVRRPNYTSVDDSLNDEDVLLKPNVAARDDTLVLGNTIYNLRNKFKVNPWGEYLDEYRKSGANVVEESEGQWACISPPCLVRVGRDIYIDYEYHKHVWNFVVPPLFELAKDYRIHVSMIDGHSDCVFCPIDNELIMTTSYKKSYGTTFPTWEIHDISDNFDMKPKNMGGLLQWNLPDESIRNNSKFINYTNDTIPHWVGDYTETIFDVNILVIDDKNVMTVGEDEATAEFLHKKGYNVHMFDFRCKNFWDSGMHCLTNDIRREGDCVDYFPNRGGNGMDWLID